jgi:sugar phosphate isomerase/epimerase
MMPLLPTSHKRLYPFRLATTSFIYPDDYVPNVRLLGAFVDEIELLVFESDALPSEHTVRELASLSREQAVGYNVHLPLDVSIGHGDSHRRARAVETLLRVFDRVAPLSPSTLTLHVPWENPPPLPEDRRPWKEAVHGSLTELTAAIGDPARLSIETLDYPLEWMADVIEALGLSVCMDVGHLLRRGQDPDSFFRSFASRISIIHLHGVQNGRDHLSPAHLPPSVDESLRRLLGGFTGIVSLEVFSFDALAASLGWLEARLQNYVSLAHRNLVDSSAF